MALTTTNITMIDAIVHGDMQKAKSAALASLKEDKTKKNEWAIQKYEKLLKNSAFSTMEAIPPGLKTFLAGDVPSNFHDERYYLSDRNQGIAEDICRMHRISARMTDRGINFPNTALFYGEPGNGKTELARYIAYKLHQPYFYLNFATAIDSYMGKTGNNIYRAFEYIKTCPCVFIIDEIDCVALKRRGRDNAGGELERTTISVMQAIDDLPNSVTVIACTNRQELLDDALLDRFSLKHEIKTDKMEMTAMADKFLRTTGTRKYMTSDRISEIVLESASPRQLIRQLELEVGKKLYEEFSDDLAEEDGDGMLSDIWEVTRTYTEKVAAETEDEAIAIAKRHHDYHDYAKGREIDWSAKRLEAFMPAPQAKAY